MPVNGESQTYGVSRGRVRILTDDDDRGGLERLLERPQNVRFCGEMFNPNGGFGPEALVDCSDCVTVRFKSLTPRRMHRIRERQRHD
jgi:hypothetical protein